MDLAHAFRAAWEGGGLLGIVVYVFRSSPDSMEWEMSSIEPACCGAPFPRDYFRCGLDRITWYGSVPQSEALYTSEYDQFPIYFGPRGIEFEGYFSSLNWPTPFKFEAAGSCEED